MAFEAPVSAVQSLASTAFSLYTEQKEIEGRKLKLSRMSFVLDAFRISGSVLPRIFSSVLFITLYSTIIAIADIVYDAKWKTSNSIVGPLSVVVGLLLVFRNSTSYDRWYEGRKLIQDTLSTSRSLALLIWLNVDIDLDPEKRRWRLQRKARALRLLAAFMVASKHHLRQEPGTHWSDYQGLLPNDWISQHGAPSVSSSSSAPSKIPGPSDIERAQVLSESSPLLPTEADGFDAMEMETPHRILAELSAYIVGARRAGLLADAGPAGFSLLNTQLINLANQLSSMIRVSSTKVPVVYGIHLKQCCLLYLLALPITLVSELGYRMIPVTTLVAITLIGLEGISSEIEDPFGDDPSDHPLDLFCSSLRLDIERIIQHVDPTIRQE